MEGVQILNEFVYDYGEVIPRPWLAAVMILLTIGGIGVIVCILAVNEWRGMWPVYGLFASIIIIAIAIAVGVMAPTETETRYQVLISDEVNFKEFNERYEVVSQDGLIYTVRERESE
jgi:hypothetical protein